MDGIPAQITKIGTNSFDIKSLYPPLTSHGIITHTDEAERRLTEFSESKRMVYIILDDQNNLHFVESDFKIV